MKTNYKIAISAIAICGLGSYSSFAAAPSNSGNSGNSPAPTTIPTTPAGSLTATPTNVQVGTYPKLSWSILYPSKVSDVAVVNPPGTIKLTQSMYVSVQPIGTGVSGMEISACAPGQVSTSLPTEARMSVSGGAYTQLFYGTQADVDSSYSLYVKKLPVGSTLDFGGRYVSEGSWSPFYTTKSDNFQVVALVNGEYPPTQTPLYSSPSLTSYLKPYLDSAGKVKIGPLSVLVMMELQQTNHSASCFDYQDQVLLVSFSSKHPNNGHGNNLDGVDSSNPGQGSGGPNGAVDPSGGVDDERK
jgi:hypothetical protein